ncbi:MAG: 4-hydroxy-tetrahydrodipicolinate synthase [Bacillota bacterium]
MYKSFGNLLTAMVTPFDKNLKVDFDKVRKLARNLVDEGNDGLVVLGTTGEVPTLNHKEKLEILRTVVDEVGDEVNVVAGTGSYSTEASIKLSKEAKEIGVDGVMIVVPYYNKPPQYALYNHFKEIAESIDLPILMYNVPSRTSRNMEAETIKKLAEIDNIIAIKEASGDLGQVAEISLIEKEDFYIYSGDDMLTLPIMSLGGEGVVSVAGHVAASKIKEMITSFKSGNPKKARELNKELIPVYNAMFIDTNPIPVKEALNLSGFDAGIPRPPLYRLRKEKKEILAKVLKEAGLIK